MAHNSAKYVDFPCPSSPGVDTAPKNSRPSDASNDGRSQRLALMNETEQDSPFRENFMDLLQCAVCMELLTPPIFQCNEGHILCGECNQKLTRCPTCRSGNIDIRCRVLERMAESLENLPCRNEKNGCRSRLRYLQLREHESKCPMAPPFCPQCNNFEGTSDEVVAHLCQLHRYEQHTTSRIDFRCTRDNATICMAEGDGDKQKQSEAIAITPCTWQNQIFSCFDKHFVLRIHRKVEGDPQYYISIVGLHSRHHSNRYQITVEGNHRKYSFEGPVWSVRKGFREIERVRDCLILPENIALFLSGGKGSENDLSVINLSVGGEIFSPGLI